MIEPTVAVLALNSTDRRSNPGLVMNNEEMFD